MPTPLREQPANAAVSWNPLSRAGSTCRFCFLWELKKRGKRSFGWSRNWAAEEPKQPILRWRNRTEEVSYGWKCNASASEGGADLVGSGSVLRRRGGGVGATGESGGGQEGRQ